MNVTVQNSHIETLFNEELIKSNDDRCNDESSDQVNRVSITENENSSSQEVFSDEIVATRSESAPVEVESIDPLELEVHWLAESRLRDSKEETTLNEARIAVKRQLTETVFQRLHIVDRESAKQEFGIRFNAIHVLGVNHMSTDQIRAYFSAYPPVHVEWLDDRHANVVWKNDACALRALIYMTLPDALGMDSSAVNSSSDLKGKKLKPVESKDVNDDDDDDIFSSNSYGDNSGPKKADLEKVDVMEVQCKDDNEDDFDVVKSNKVILSGDSEDEKREPEGFWLRGRPYFRSRALFLRYATRFDRKKRGSDRRSEFYRRHGNPNFFGMTGIISHSYRQLLRGNDPRAVRVAKFKDPDDFIGKRWSGYDVSQQQERGVSLKEGSEVAAASSDEYEEKEEEKPDGREMDLEKELNLLIGKRAQLVSMKLVSDEMDEGKNTLKGAHRRLGGSGDSEKVTIRVHHHHAHDDAGQQQRSGEIRPWDQGKEATQVTRKRKRSPATDSEYDKDIVRTCAVSATVHSRLGPPRAYGVSTVAKSRRIQVEFNRREDALSGNSTKLSAINAADKVSSVRQLELITTVVKQEPVDVDAVVSDKVEKNTKDSSSRRQPVHKHTTRRSPLKKIARNTNATSRTADRSYDRDRRRSDRDFESSSNSLKHLDKRRQDVRHLRDEVCHYLQRSEEDYRRDFHRQPEINFNRFRSSRRGREEPPRESSRARITRDRRVAQNVPSKKDRELDKKYDGRQISRFSRHDRSEKDRWSVRNGSRRISDDGHERRRRQRHEQRRLLYSKSKSPSRRSHNSHTNQRTTSSFRYKDAARAPRDPAIVDMESQNSEAAHFYSTWIRRSRSRSNLSSVSSSITSTSSSSSSSSSITTSSEGEFSDENNEDDSAVAAEMSNDSDGLTQS